MKTVFEKQWKIGKYHIQTFASRYRTVCMICNYESEFYKPKAFDTLEEAKEYGENYLTYLDSVTDEF